MSRPYAHPIGLTRRAFYTALGVAAFLTPLAQATADGFPARPITLILPVPPGGIGDLLLRSLADPVAKELGQPVLIVSKAGGGAVPGTASLVTQGIAPDGYTLALMHNGVIRHPLVQKVSWDPLGYFTYIIGLASLSTLVAVRADAPWKTLPELLADTRNRPGLISYGSVGAASANRIAGEHLARVEGGRFNIIPFKGGAEAITALLGGHLDVYGDPGIGPLALSGKVRILATLTDHRIKRLANVPTAKELGYNVAVYSPIGLVGPRGMDPAIATRLHDAFRKAMSDPAVQTILENHDAEPFLMKPGEYHRYAREWFAREKALLPELGFKLD